MSGTLSDTPLSLREIARPRDRPGPGPDHDRDLLAVGQLDRTRILPIGLAVDVERDRLGTAVLPNTGLAELDAPLREELAEGVGLGALRFGVDDTRHVMGVEGRDAGLAASRDAAVGGRTVSVLEPLHLGVVDVDPDRRGHRDRLAIDEDIQMRMDVMAQE